MESAQAFAWIDSTCRADSALMALATGGVWQGYANIGVTAPYVLFVQQAASDVLTMNVKRLFVRLLVQIKAVGPVANYATLVQMADRIDALFGRSGPVTLPVQGGVLCCYREQALAYEEPIINGAQWSHLGGLYTIQLQGS